MNHKRTTKRNLIIGGAGVAAIAAAAIILPNANASQSNNKTDAAPKTLSANAASDLLTQLTQQLGSALAGGWYDKASSQLVINIVNGDNNRIDTGDSNNVIIQVKDAGARVNEVNNSTEALQAGAKTLAEKATIPGTAWAVDPKTNQIVVTADSSVTGAKWNQLESTVKSLGTGMARIQKSAGTFTTKLDGGDAIFSQVQDGEIRCSLGFNVKASDGTPAFLTAGHCGVAAKDWSDSQTGQPIATVDQATFPGDGDFSLVKFDDPNTQVASEVNVGNGKTVAINQAVDAVVGEQVFRMGSTTGLHDGTVTALDATVNFQSETDPNGVDTVTGLIQTNVCAEAGDSGGSLFTADGGAVGMTSGGSGDCTTGGETFFQPVTTALAATGATLGDGGAGAGGDASATVNPSDSASPSDSAGDAGNGAGNAGDQQQGNGNAGDQQQGADQQQGTGIVGNSSN